MSSEMRVMTITEARKRWGAVLKLAQNEPVLIRRRGRDVCVFVPVEEYDRTYGTDSRKPQQAPPRVER
jgi:prevent-host-death family protein